MTAALERRIRRLEARLKRLEDRLASPVPGPLPPLARAPLGANIEGVADFARLLPFVDLMKGSRPWGSVAEPWDEAAPADALGWPTGDAAVVIHMVTREPGEQNASNILPGTYALSWEGKAVVSPVASSGVTITNYKYDASTKVATANVVVAAATQLMLAFQQTSGGVRNVRLLRPGYTFSDKFTRQFREAVAPFSVLRFMDFTRTNNNQVVKWSERTTPAHATQASARGAAWEHVVEIANELGKDAWINVPARADDSYIRSLAKLLRDSLNQDRVVYVEFSNELWNFIFDQATDNLLAAKADPSLAVGAEADNEYWQAYRRVGKMAVRVSKIFQDVFGPGTINKRFRVVYATQFAYRSMAEQTLKYIATQHGAPSSFLYGVAGAPYYALAEAEAAAPALSVDALLGRLGAALAETVPAFATGPYDGGDFRNVTMKALADFYKIKSIAYEGGNDLLQSEVNIANKVAAQYDQRAGAQTEEYLNAWFAEDNDLFMYFTLSSGWGRYGYWGLTNDPNNLNLPKYQAAKRVAEDQS